MPDADMNQPTRTILDVIRESDDTRLFYILLKITGLNETVRLASSATIFAPTNAAVVKSNEMGYLREIGRVLQSLLVHEDALRQFTNPTTNPVAASQTHTVVANENLSRIAAHYNTTVDALVAANNIADSRLIHPGQQLTIPSASIEQPAPTDHTFPELAHAISYLAHLITHNSTSLWYPTAFHIIPNQAIQLSNVTGDESYLTLSNDDISLSHAGDRVEINMDDSVNVIEPDLLATNGVVHKIDQFLYPRPTEPEPVAIESRYRPPSDQPFGSKWLP
jgi:LysM repeat protein